jgi:hypothetical protein
MRRVSLRLIREGPRFRNQRRLNQRGRRGGNLLDKILREEKNGENISQSYQDKMRGEHQTGQR